MQSAFTRLRLVGCQTQSDNVIEAGSLRALIDPEALHKPSAEQLIEQTHDSYE
jgi:hypothetical protein